MLSDEGIAVVHTIGNIRTPKLTPTFIRKYIFPGGYIPSLSEIMPAIERSGLIISDIEVLRLHYAKTLSHWFQNFKNSKDEVLKLYDERFIRMWEALLNLSDLSVLNKIMELDFFSVVQFTKSILPHMVSRKSGQIVTNTSVAGLVGSRNRSFYSSAKFALHGFFDSLRSEIIYHNVHVTLIAPGRVATDIGKNALTSTGEPYGKDDRGHQKGLTSSEAAKRILRAIKNKKREAVICLLYTSDAADE